MAFLKSALLFTVGIMHDILIAPFFLAISRASVQRKLLAYRMFSALPQIDIHRNGGSGSGRWTWILPRPAAHFNSAFCFEFDH